MHDVNIHFGDLFKDWSKFNNRAWGIGMKLLMRYYSTEKPLSADPEELEYLADVIDDDDRRALAMVLKRVFVLDEAAQVYRQKRADKEIGRYHYRRDASGLSNLKKDAKNHPQNWPANIQQLTLDEFLAHRDVFQCPSTFRLRFCPSGSEPERSGSETEPNGTGTEPKRSRTAALTSETVPFGPLKPPFAGVLFPLPSSPPASCLLPGTPIAPKGVELPPAASSTEDSEQLDSVVVEDDEHRESKPAAARRKKKRAAREPGAMRIPETWSDARQATMLRWLSYKRELGKAYKATGWDALITRMAPLSDAELEACVNHSMSNNWLGLFPEQFGAKHPEQFGEKKGGRGGTVQQPTNATGAVMIPPPCLNWKWFAGKALGLTIPETMGWEQVPINRRNDIAKAFAESGGAIE